MNRTKSSAIIIARPLNKTDQTLFSEFYNVSESNIRRRETSFNICDFIVLDVDNGKSVEEFNLYMKNNFDDALHYIAPSFSSTEEFPKFRVFIPLDSPLLFFPDIPGGITTQERIKAYKQLKFCLFYDFQDPKCQLWYFSPYQVPERYGNQSCLFSSEHMYNVIEELVINQRARHWLSLQDKNSIYTREREKEIVQNEKAKFGSKIYPSATIIKIINESPVGNRDRCIFNIVFNHMDAKDIDIIRAGINDAEKLKMFNEKVQRKFGFR